MGNKVRADDAQHVLAEELRAAGVEAAWSGSYGELTLALPSGRRFVVFPDNYGDELGVDEVTSAADALRGDA